MPEIKNIAGQVFARLTALERVGCRKNRAAVWKCECSCGNFKDVRLACLTSGRTKSCGCLQRDNARKMGAATKTHGMTGSPEHAAYVEARWRCSTDTKSPNADYAGKGIKFLFTSFEQWYRELGPRPSPKHGVDRINTLGHYEPGNVRWATAQEQAMNKRKVRRLCTSKFKGVARISTGRRKKNLTAKFRACIKADGRIITLGSFRDETEAAHKYDEAARQHFGQFAHTNFQAAV